VFAARCRIQLFSILSFVCYVLYLCKDLWVLDWCAMVVLDWCAMVVLDWCAMVVLLVVCAVSCGIIHYLHCVDVGH